MFPDDFAACWVPCRRPTGSSIHATSSCPCSSEEILKTGNFLTTTNAFFHNSLRKLYPRKVVNTAVTDNLPQGLPKYYKDILRVTSDWIALNSHSIILLQSNILELYTLLYLRKINYRLLVLQFAKKQKTVFPRALIVSPISN